MAKLEEFVYSWHYHSKRLLSIGLITLYVIDLLERIIIFVRKTFSRVVFMWTKLSDPVAFGGRSCCDELSLFTYSLRYKVH